MKGLKATKGQTVLQNVKPKCAFLVPTEPFCVTSKVLSRQASSSGNFLFIDDFWMPRRRLSLVFWPLFVVLIFVSNSLSFNILLLKVPLTLRHSLILTIPPHRCSKPTNDPHYLYVIQMSNEHAQEYDELLRIKEIWEIWLKGSRSHNRRDGDKAGFCKIFAWRFSMSFSFFFFNTTNQPRMTIFNLWTLPRNAEP